MTSELMEGLTRFDWLAGGYEGWFSTRIGALVDRRERALVGRLVGPHAGQVILEVGSGTGHFIRELARSGARCVGLDPSGEMLAVAVAQSAPRVEHVLGRGESLPFADAAFDCVAFITTLEFVADVELALREASRVCKEGGRLVCVVLNARGVWYRQRQAEGGLWSETPFFRVEELRALLARYGDVTIDYCVHAPPACGWMPAWALNLADAGLRWIWRPDGALIGAMVELRRKP